MARFKIRIELNKGREGIPPRKLIAHTERLEEFLKSLATDLNVEDGKNVWLAKDFQSGSCIYSLELQAVESAVRQARFNEKVRAITSYEPDKELPPEGVSETTLVRYSNIREGLEIGEPIRFGLFRSSDETEPEWLDGSRSQMQNLAESSNVRIDYVGSVMGVVHELNKGASPPYIKVRDIVSGDLVRCDYQNKDYDRVIGLVKRRDAIVNVYGLVTMNRLTKRIDLIKAIQFDVAPSFSKADYESFFGCAPGLLDQESSDDCIRKSRKNGRN